MRKVILGLAVSLDGFIEGPDGEYDWCFADQDYGLSKFFQQVDTVFIGRRSYEMTMTIGKSPGPKLKEYIFSRTLNYVKEGATLIKRDIRKEVQKIKKAEGKDIWLFGGSGLTTSLINLGLVDKLWLSVHPIILGGGKPLFSNIENRVNLKLADSKTYSSGLVSLTYLIE
ncbi:dihydrofolate reductase family protein [Ekhidna sp.]|uniref:dihydrofolate reductase family protein n=1 Tax=Ekhidna sp. TaxID=2608089 RepID=UPI003BABF52E